MLRGVRWLGVGLMLLACAAPCLAGEDGGSLDRALITPKVGTFFWTLVTFLIMVFLLGRFAWKPLLGAIEDRERSIREAVDQARSDREQAQALLGEHRSLVSEARRERAEALSAGQRDAERLKEEIIAEARRQGEHIRHQTQAQIEASMRQAKADLRATAADLAIRAAEKLLAASLDEARHRKLVEDHLADLERSPPGRGATPPS